MIWNCHRLAEVRSKSEPLRAPNRHRDAAGKQRAGHLFHCAVMRHGSEAGPRQYQRSDSLPIPMTTTLLTTDSECRRNDGAVPGSLVDVRRWVSEIQTPRMLFRTHQIAAPLRHKVGAGAATRPVRKCHTTLPGAVWLDGSIALAQNGSSIPAAGAGRRR